MAPFESGSRDTARGQNVWDDYEHLEHLLNPDREALFPRTAILQALRLGEGMRVADVGAGSGYLLDTLALAVGHAGRVFAVDPAPAARRHLAERSAGRFPHVTVLDGRCEAVPVDAATLDRAVWLAVYHEIEDPGAAFVEARRVLKPGGRLLIVDFDPADDSEGPPKQHRVERSTARAAGLDAGFQDDLQAPHAISQACWALSLTRP